MVGFLAQNQIRVQNTFSTYSIYVFSPPALSLVINQKANASDGFWIPTWMLDDKTANNNFYGLFRLVYIEGLI